MSLHLGTVAAIAAVALALATCHHDRSQLQAARQQTQAVAATANVQGALDQAVTRRVDHAQHRAALSQAATDEAVDALHRSPSATDPLPADLLDAWRRGVERVRKQSDLEPSGADPERPGDPDPAVPAP